MGRLLVPGYPIGADLCPSPLLSSLLTFSHTSTLFGYPDPCVHPSDIPGLHSISEALEAACFISCIHWRLSWALHGGMIAGMGEAWETFLTHRSGENCSSRTRDYRGRCFHTFKLVFLSPSSPLLPYVLLFFLIFLFLLLHKGPSPSYWLWQVISVCSLGKQASLVHTPGKGTPRLSVTLKVPSMCAHIRL